MAKSTVAIIDLGSNTFHLLIAEIVGNSFSRLYRERQYTFLSEGGSDLINAQRLVQAVNVIRDFANIIAIHNVSSIRVIGTEMLRKAKNASPIIEAVRDFLNVELEVIDGIKEANSIYKGIMLFDQFKVGSHIIMDIGGGSTEFIIIKNGENIWARSYPLGLGVLYSLFPIDGPATEEQINALKTYIAHQLDDLCNKVKTMDNVDSIIGASGSFEVLLTMSGEEIQEDSVTSIHPSMFDKIYTSIITSSVEDRNSMEGLPSERINLIVVAMILCHHVYKDMLPLVNKINFCPYALKEGLISEMMV